MPLNIPASLYYSENIDYRLGVKASTTGDYRKPLQSSQPVCSSDSHVLFEILMCAKMDVEKCSAAA